MGEFSVKSYENSCDSSVFKYHFILYLYVSLFMIFFNYQCGFSTLAVCKLFGLWFYIKLISYGTELILVQVACLLQPVLFLVN